MRRLVWRVRVSPVRFSGVRVRGEREGLVWCTADCIWKIHNTVLNMAMGLPEKPRCHWLPPTDTIQIQVLKLCLCRRRCRWYTNTVRLYKKNVPGRSQVGEGGWNIQWQDSSFQQSRTSSHQKVISVDLAAEWVEIRSEFYLGVISSESCPSNENNFVIEFGKSFLGADLMFKFKNKNWSVKLTF
jgi:hypothetical protein